jgi:hypothetical protein
LKIRFESTMFAILLVAVVAFTAAAVSAHSPLFHPLTSSGTVQEMVTSPEQRTVL